MKLLFKGLTALLIVVVLGTALDVKASAQEAPKDGKPTKESHKKVDHRDFDGELLATCDHPVDHEKRQVKEHQKDPDGNNVVVDVTFTDEVSMSCPSAPPTSVGTGVATAALANWQWWICRGSSEKDTLLGMNYKITLEQWFQTSPFTNVVWPPPTPSVTAQTGLGWNLSGNPTANGPYPYSYYGSAIMSGLSMGSAQFNYPLFWWNVQTASKSISLVFSYGRCSWTK